MANIFGGSASRLEVYALFVAAVVLIGGGIAGAIIVTSDDTNPAAVAQALVDTTVVDTSVAPTTAPPVVTTPAATPPPAAAQRDNSATTAADTSMAVAVKRYYEIVNSFMVSASGEDNYKKIQALKDSSGRVALSRYQEYCSLMEPAERKIVRDTIDFNWPASVASAATAYAKAVARNAETFLRCINSPNTSSAMASFNQQIGSNDSEGARSDLRVALGLS